MRIIKLLIVFAFIAALNGNIIAQTNLIYNPGFESGSIPTGLGGLTSGLVSHWTDIGFPYYYSNGDPDPSINICRNGTSDVYDKRSTSCAVGVPKNNSGTLNERTTGNRYAGFLGGNWFPIHGTSPQQYRYLYDESLSGTFDPGTIQYGCTYTISFYAALATKLGNCGTAPTNAPTPGNYNQIEVILRKSSTTASACHDNIVVWTSPNITSSSWTQYSGTFSITYAEYLKGYDRIDFRFIKIPEDQKSVKSSAVRYLYMDDVSLTASTTYTTTPGYTYNNLNIAVPTTWNNISALLQGVTTLNGNLTITNNCKVRLTDNAKIVVKSGRKLTISGSTLEGMCNMWDKIEVENGGEVSITGSNLYDMRNGVRVNGASSKLTITTSTFDRNYVSVYLFQTNMSSTSSSITSNNFNAKQALKDKTMTNSGYGEYGIRIVKCVGTTTIGASSQSNTFDNNNYGIWIEDANTEIKYNYFYNNRERAIMCFNGFLFNGTKYMYGTNSPLKVTGNLLSKNKIGLEIIGKSDNVKISGGNKFQFNTEYGIKVSLARGSQSFVIGDGSVASAATTSSNENSFLGNNLGGIYLYDNGKSAQDIFTKKYYGETEITIGRNFFSNSVNSDGIIVQEPTKGSNKVFKQLDILENTLWSTGKGIRFSNIVGNNGDVITSTGSQNPEKTVPGAGTTRLLGNRMEFSANQNPNFTGIEAKNSNSVQINQSYIINYFPQQWQNKGIWTDFTEHTLVNANSINGTGYGLNAGGVALGSNYVCNIFENYNSGIHLNFQTLRNPSDVHGKINSTGNIARPNNFYTPYSWATDIHVYNSAPNNNKWIFETGVPTPAIKYTGFSGTIVHAQTGINNCTNLQGTPPFNPGNDQGGGTQLLDAFTDAYRLESYYVNEDSTLIGSTNPTIAKLIKVENLFRNGSYVSALHWVDSITPSNLLDSNYKTVLKTLVVTRPNDTTIIPVDSIGVVKLSAIASQNVQVGGPAVYLARAILKYEQNLEFDDEDYKVTTLRGQMISASPCTDSLDAIPLTLVDTDGNIVSIPPVYTALNGVFALDPLAIATLDSTKSYGFIVPFPSNYSIRNSTFKTLSAWRSDNTISLDVIQVEPFTLTDTLTGFTTDSVATDALGNTYTATTQYSAGNTDILVVKKNASNTEIWRKNYKGWAGLADSAHIVLLDSNNNVYVGGTTKDSTSTNAIVLKYDANGNLLMAQIFKDSLGSNTRVTAIKKGNYGTLYVKYILGSTPLNLTYVSCDELPYPDAPSEDEFFVLPTSVVQPIKDLHTIKVFPNPNNGSLNISLPEPMQSSNFKLFNLAGVEVMSKTIENSLANFYIGNLQDGIYFYTITNETSGEVSRGKIILKK